MIRCMHIFIMVIIVNLERLIGLKLFLGVDSFSFNKIIPKSVCPTKMADENFT